MSLLGNRRGIVILALMLTAALACAAVLLVDGATRPARAGAFPGKNGHIAFTTARDDAGGDFEIFSMNADGSNQTNLSNDHPFYDVSPSWQPLH